MYCCIMKTRQITFRIPSQLWEDFSIKALKKQSNKSKILIELIEKFMKEK